MFGKTTTGAARKKKLGLRGEALSFSMCYPRYAPFSQIVIEQEGEKDKTYADFEAAMRCFSDPPMPRYAVCDVDYKTPDGRPQDKLVFISWSPDDAPVRQRMVYASTKAAMTKCLDGVNKCLQCVEMADLEKEEVVKNIMR